MSRLEVDRPKWWSSDYDSVHRTLDELIRTRFADAALRTIEEARRIAETGHEHQTRSGGEPYLIHPYRIVLSLLLELDVSSPELIQAALLHDVAEDAGIEPQTLREPFGDRVAGLVAALTRTEKRPPAGDDLTDPYIQGIVRCGRDAVLLKVADKLDNLRDALNHPKPQKRVLFVREGYTVFLPLLRALGKEDLERRAAALLMEAMGRHEFFDEEAPARHYIEVLRSTVDALPPGAAVGRRKIAAQVYGLDEIVDVFLTFNPHLAYWLNDDGVELRKGRVEPTELIVNLAQRISALIRRRAFGRLARLAGLPDFLGESSAGDLWRRVEGQLLVLVELLEDAPPVWLGPIREQAPCLAAVVHSRLYRPASWSFPLWERDFGAALAEQGENAYHRVLPDEDAARFSRLVAMLLDERLALWRYQTGAGSLERASSVLGSLGGMVNGEVARETLVSMRLLSEYLDSQDAVKTTSVDSRRRLDGVWEELVGTSFESLTGKGPRLSRLLGLAAAEDRELPAVVDVVGAEEVAGLLAEDRERRALGQLIQGIAGAEDKGAEGPTWIVFHVQEIRKRLLGFREALRQVHQLTKTAGGLRVEADQTVDRRVISVEPGPEIAFRNRLPEATDDQIKALLEAGFSAAKIFDVMLAQPLESGDTPLFMPRVYRILDTLADLDPSEVQKLRLSFPRHPGLEVPLPLPRGEAEASGQGRRKEVLARYLVAVVASQVVVLGVESVHLDCDRLGKAQRRHGFSRRELEATLGRVAGECGFSGLARYVRRFHARTFRFETDSSGDVEVPFTQQDMAFGTFLGIDVGGTNVKARLFRQGRPGEAIEFSTFPGESPVDDDAFFDRVLEKVEEGAGPGLDWTQVSGIGISWPSAVRDSRIVGFSLFVGKVRWRGLPQLDWRSSPEELQSLDLPGRLRRRLQERCPAVSDALVVVFLNDGDAEAYGNFCALERQGPTRLGDKLIIKPGTSLAGGHVTATGRLSGEPGEFAKAVLDFQPLGAAAPGEAAPDLIHRGGARQFVSSIGVRNLSRQFFFEGTPVFGDLGGSNGGDDLETRVESVEIGELVDLWQVIDGEPGRFLDRLKEHDNRSAGSRYQELVDEVVLYPGLESWRSQYTLRRGCERLAVADGLVLGPVARRGRALWQAQTDGSLRESDADFLKRAMDEGRMRLSTLLGDESTDPEALARVVLGSVALFSQLGLHVAHLIVLLYNTYRSSRTGEVILAGGPMRGAAGYVVKRQAEAFLLKYYDKVYGPGRGLEPGSISLATEKDAAVVGTLGAAMHASRSHKVAALAELQNEVDLRLRQLLPGGRLEVESVLRDLGHPRLDTDNVRQALEGRVARSELFPEPAARGVYLKPVQR